MNPGRLLRLIASTRLFAVMLLMTSIGRTAAAQDVTAPVLKAAFLYNFAKFTEWPSGALAPRQRLSLCVVGDRGVAAALEQTINGNAIENHELTVTLLRPETPTLGCHLLYISATESKHIDGLLAHVKDAPVLTASDADAFLSSGGIAQLIVQKNQIQFGINAAAAGRAGIRLSSKLLRLSHLLVEGSDDRR
jgi:hypothetical protein